ncbi:hypothetical protein KM043_005933 [Ampulex compressa]|nr:hypothetical protein KM043_005933 [Ampulex compressa]
MSVYDGYQQDVNYITEQCRFVLRIIGIWPIFEEKIPFTTRIAKNLAILASYMSLLCNAIPGILYYVYDKEPDPRVKLKHAVAVIYACMTVAKYSSLVFHEDDIKGCFGHVKEDWKMLGGISYRECMMERVRSGRQLFVFCGSCMYISGMSYSTVVPLSRGKVVVDENTTIRPLTYPTYYVFFDEQESPAYEIVFLIQVFAGFVSYTITTALCGLAALFVMHGCAQLEILEEMMNDLARKETLKDYLALDTLNDRLALVVEHHVRVRNFMRMVEIALQKCTLVEIVACTSIICLLGYCALMEWEDGNTAAVCTRRRRRNSPSTRDAPLINRNFVGNLRIRPVREESSGLQRMSAYEGYEQDVNYTTEQCRFVLRILGIWPVLEGKISAATRIGKILALLTCYLLLLSDIVPGILYYAYGIEPDPRIRLKFLVVEVYIGMMLAKYSSLVLHENDIKKCLYRVQEDWKIFGRDSYRDSMMQRVRSGRRIFALFGSFVYVTGVSYSTLVPLSRGKIVLDENTTIRPLSCPTYYIFFDEQKSPAYEIVFLLQILAGLVTYTISTALCSLMAVFVMHACSQLEILADALNGLVQTETLKNETLNCKLAFVVEHHIRVRNFVHMVEITLQECSLIEIVGCTSIICLLAYCALMEWEDGNSGAVVSFACTVTSTSFNIFLLCYIGDQLTTQAEKIAWTTCTLEWYRISDKNVRSLVMIMAMSSASMQITAGKFIPLSIKTFGDVRIFHSDTNVKSC